jgi:hypothetical protein
LARVWSVDFGRKDPADTRGQRVQGGEGGERVATADLAAGRAGGVVRRDRLAATTLWVPLGRDAASKSVGGAIVFGMQGFEALRTMCPPRLTLRCELTQVCPT